MAPHFDALTPTILQARRHNDRQPVSKIPPEILNHIFLLLRQAFDYPLRANVDISSTSYSEIFSFTSVCHDWRSLSQDHAQLWSRLDFRMYPVHVCKEMAVRSKGCPLDVILCVGLSFVRRCAEKYASMVLEVIEPLIPRLRDVHWGLGCSSLPEFLAQVHRHSTASGSSSVLRTIDILWDRFSFSSESEPLILPGPCEGFHSLTSLRLADVPINWESTENLFNPSVNELVLRPNQWQLPTPDQLALFLSRFPALEDLQLLSAKYDRICSVDANEVYSGLVDRDHMQVHLGNLRRITVNDGTIFSSFVPLLRRFILPEELTWDISCNGVFFDGDKAGLSTLFNVVIATTAAHDLQIHGYGETGTVLVTSLDTSSSSSCTTPSISLKFCTDGKGSLNFRTFSKVFEELTEFPGVRTFHYGYTPRKYEMSYVTEFSEQEELRQWRKFLKKQSSDLTALTIKFGRALPNVLRALVSYPGDDLNPAAPGLRRLDLEADYERHAIDDAVSPLLLSFFAQRKALRDDFALTLVARCSFQEYLSKTLIEAGAKDVCGRFVWE